MMATEPRLTQPVERDPGDMSTWTPEEILALPWDAEMRELVTADVAALFTDDTLITLSEAAEMFGVSLAAPSKWRNHSAVDVREGRDPALNPNAMPEADIVVGRIPMWRAGRLRVWGLRTARLTLPNLAPVSRQKRR